MEIGVFTYGPTAYCDTAVLAQKAEELGYHSYWVPEHPILPVTYAARLAFYPEGVPTFYAELADPFVALARASAVTKTIQLGTGICLVPERVVSLLFGTGFSRILGDRRLKRKVRDGTRSTMLSQ